MKREKCFKWFLIFQLVKLTTEVPEYISVGYSILKNNTCFVNKYQTIQAILNKLLFCTILNQLTQ